MRRKAPTARKSWIWVRDVAEDPTYIKETYGDWQLKCFRSEGQEDLCQMYQLLKEDAGNPVAEFSIFKLPENGQAEAGATIVVPLGTLLTKELLISVDGGKAKSFAYSFCSMVGVLCPHRADERRSRSFQTRRKRHVADRPRSGPRSKGQHQGVTEWFHGCLRKRFDGTQLTG